MSARRRLNLDNLPRSKSADARRRLPTPRGRGVLEPLPGTALDSVVVCPGCGHRIIAIGRATCHLCETRLDNG